MRRYRLIRVKSEHPPQFESARNHGYVGEHEDECRSCAELAVWIYQQDCNGSNYGSPRYNHVRGLWLSRRCQLWTQHPPVSIATMCDGRDRLPVSIFTRDVVPAYWSSLEEHLSRYTPREVEAFIHGFFNDHDFICPDCRIAPTNDFWRAVAEGDPVFRLD